MSSEVVQQEAVSDQDRKAIDEYYDYGGDFWEIGWHSKRRDGLHVFPQGSDEDRIEWMDHKDTLKRQDKDTDLPIFAGIGGVGIAAVLFNPGSWFLALGAGAIFVLYKVRKELSKKRMLYAYGRTFIFDRKGRVVEAARGQLRSSSLSWFYQRPFIPARDNRDR
ncbi:hypothetical protein [Bradyrhizobium sp. DASA03120]|uniref:hypothetical protein n=1 Tax=Bradyrhizobium sp. SMVTL-02 TaxID=3395917 RepID=UPI003F72A107